MIGHAITPLITIFLPTREELEAKSYKKGKQVTLLRRFVSFVIDIFFLSIFSLAMKILLFSTSLDKYYMLVTISLYYLVIPLFTSGKTLGKKILRLKIEGLFSKAKWYQILTRNILLTGLVLYPYIWVNYFYLSKDVSRRLWEVIIICQTANILYYIFTLPKNTHLFLYEKLTQTKVSSTIESNYTLNLTLSKEDVKEEQIKLDDNNIEQKTSTKKK